MGQTRRLVCFVLVSLYCLTHCVLVIASDDGLSIKARLLAILLTKSSIGRPTAKLSPKIDSDIFLDDDIGSGSRGMDDLEISGSGNGFDDVDDEDRVTVSNGEGSNNNGIFHVKDDNSPSLFSQPGILAALVFGCIFVAILNVLLFYFVMFLVYRMRKADEGTSVLDNESKRPTQSYGKSKEFFA